MLLKAAEKDLVNYSEMGSQLIMRYDVSEDVYDDMDKFQYPMPMVSEPKTVNQNWDSAYYTLKCSMLLKSGNHHDDDICLDHLNRQNSVALSLDEDVIAFCENQWDGVTNRKSSMTDDEYKQLLTTFEKFKKVGKDVAQHLMVHGNRFFMTYRYDKRGRCYAQGYHINPQGNDYQKAMVSFAHQEVPTSA